MGIVVLSISLARTCCTPPASFNASSYEPVALIITHSAWVNAGMPTEVLAWKLSTF